MNDAQLAVKNWDRKSSRPAAFAVREIAGFNKYWGIFECEDVERVEYNRVIAVVSYLIVMLA